MYKISKNRYLKILMCFILSITLTTGIMYKQKQEVEAAIAIPLVAIPIIKSLIAGGVTFMSVDAMLEAYNRFTGYEHYSTITGDVSDKLQRELDEIMDKAEVQQLLDYYFPGGMKPDPNDPEWNSYRNLTIGTIAVSVADKWGELKDWIKLKFHKGDNTDLVEGLYDHFLPVEVGNYSIGQFTVRITKDDNDDLYITSSTDGQKIKLDVTQHKYFAITGDANPTQRVYYYRLRMKRTISASGYTYSPADAVAVPYGTPIEPPLSDYLGTDELDNNQPWVNSNTSQQEVMLPLPLEVVEYDDNQEKWVIDHEKELTREEADELLSPWIGKDYTQIVQEQKEPATLPDPNPGGNPNPNPDPNPNPNPDPNPQPYDPANPGDAPPGTGTPTEPGTGGEEGEPINPDDYRLPDLFRFIFWIIILIIKLILAMLEFIIKFFRIPADPYIIPYEAQQVVIYLKTQKLPGFETSFYSIVTNVAGILLAFRFTKIFINYFKGSAEGYERESEKIIQQKYKEMMFRNRNRGKKGKGF